jgi:CHAT domain-containing protein
VKPNPLKLFPHPRRIVAAQGVCAALGALMLTHAAWAQQEAGAATTTGTPAFRVAESEARDAETMQSLTQDGRLLLKRDRFVLDGYSYCSMAVAAAERGDFRESIEASSRALQVAQQSRNADLLAVSQRDLAIAYSYAGDLDDAQRYAELALASHPAAPDQVYAPANKVLGDIALRRGDPQAAFAAYNAALQTASARYRPLVLVSMTNAHIAAGDTASARTTFEQAGPPPSSAFAPLYKRIEGNLLLAEGHAEQARAAFAASLTNDKQGDSAYDNLWAHEGMARALLALNQRDAARAAYLDAIADSESIRARFRSEEFKTGLFSDTQTVFEQAIAMAAEDGDYPLAWRLSERSRARALLDVVRNQVDSGVDTRQLNGAALTLDDVRHALRPNEALVEFHSLPHQMIVWVIRNDGLKGITLPIARDDMALAVTDFRNAIVGQKPAALAYGARLDKLLIEPLELRPNERLIIVPNLALHYMPFQALRNEQGFLIERHPIALAPSASVAVQLTQREQRVTSDLVAFADPQIAPKFELPGAATEVNDIAPLFAQRQTFMHADATRVSFHDSAPAGRVLHVATHAHADVVDPLHSSILLAPPSQPADGPDALLAKDIYNLKMHDVALVTLSACETGLGRVGRGDEIMGFTRAFFYAGASSLIVSMWPVSDDSTALTMRTFYTSLVEGHEAIDSMRSAQLAVLADPRFTHPFYWAPFDLMGSWRLTVAH